MKEQYTKWFAEEGFEYYEDVMSWAYNAPEGVDLSEMVGSLTAYAEEVCHDIFMSEQPDLFDYNEDDHSWFSYGLLEDA